MCTGALILGLAGADRAAAAISYTGGSSVVTFDGVAGDAGVVYVANDSTVPGLYLYISGGSGAAAGVPDSVYRGSGTASASGTATYSSSSYAHYFYRSTTDLSDVSLGFYNVDSNSSGVGTGYISAGLLFVNNTGQSISEVTLDYLIGRSSASLTNTDFVSVSWAIGAVGVSDASAAWTTVAGLGYSIAGNTTVTPPSTNLISGLDWDPGETLMIRFRDGNVGSTDRFHWIDDVTLTAVPEPSGVALAGLGGLLACMRRRRA